jgi:hypothetical protein
MTELGELRASLARAQNELNEANERLDALEAGEPSATALTPRAVERQRRNLIAVGLLSSLGTAVLLGLGVLVFSTKPAPVTVAVAPPVVTDSAAPTTPATPSLPPPPMMVATPEPPPPPVVTPPEPPRPPVRVARTTPTEPARTRPEPDAARTGEMGSLTIVCLPEKCDSITDNGVALGPGHIFARPVAAGAHHLKLHTASGSSKSLRVDVRADQNKEVRVQMIDTDKSGVF